MPATPAPTPTADAAALYQVLARTEPDGSALTVLHIGGSHTTLVSGHAGSAPQLLQTLDLGARVTAALHFAGEAPLPGELQAASDAALAAFAPLRERLAPGSTLYSADAGVRHMALAAGLPAQPDMQLERQALGQLLARLRTSPSADDALAPLPRQARFAAALVILHAAMLALDLSRIVIRSDAAT